MMSRASAEIQMQPWSWGKAVQPRIVAGKWEGDTSYLTQQLWCVHAHLDTDSLYTTVMAEASCREQQCGGRRKAEQKKAALNLMYAVQVSHNGTFTSQGPAPSSYYSILLSCWAFRVIILRISYSKISVQLWFKIKIAEKCSLVIFYFNWGLNSHSSLVHLPTFNHFELLIQSIQPSLPINLWLL